MDRVIAHSYTPKSIKSIPQGAGATNMAEPVESPKMEKTPVERHVQHFQQKIRPSFAENFSFPFFSFFFFLALAKIFRV
jgi:hypothetical protein